MQCDPCFRASDHRGHDVYFHHASPGGCCDCGDLEAWKLEGCCPAHSGPDLEQDPVANLPLEMVGPARAVFGAAVNLVMDACSHATQAFNRVEHHPLLARTPKPPLTAYDCYVEAERDGVKVRTDGHRPTHLSNVPQPHLLPCCIDSIHRRPSWTGRPCRRRCWRC